MENRHEYEKDLLTIIEIVGKDSALTSKKLEAMILYRALKDSWKKAASNVFNIDYMEVDSNFEIRKIITVLKNTPMFETLVLKKKEKLGNKADDYIEETELLEEYKRIIDGIPTKESKIIMVNEFSETTGKIISQHPETIVIDRYPTPAEKMKATDALYKRNFFTQVEKKKFDIQDQKNDMEELTYLSDMSKVIAIMNGDKQITSIEAEDENDEVEIVAEAEVIDDMEELEAEGDSEVENVEEQK